MNVDDTHLEVEYKRYLQILRPYLSRLSDQFVIGSCNLWIQKLSENNIDKVLRNKYIFALFSQLARGYLDMPFLKDPPNTLPPLRDDSTCSISSEECLVINPEKSSTGITFNRRNSLSSETEYSQDNDNNKEGAKTSTADDKATFVDNCTLNPIYQPNILCYTCPDMLLEDNPFGSAEVYDNRAASLINKVREIKTQNIMLHNELKALRGDFNGNAKNDFITMLDNSTSPHVSGSYSSVTLRSLKSKLQEMKYTRASLIETIANLQEKLSTFEEAKKQEIDDLESKHKLEILKIKKAVNDEVKKTYEKKLEDLKKSYENIITDLQDKSINNNEKETELERLRLQLEDQKTNFQSVLSKLLQNSNDETKDTNTKNHVQLLEKRLNKTEKSKLKCARAYEAKLASLQKDKHLAECSLHLQLVKQRAQVLSEIADENQTDLTAALNNLEIKYKDIMANALASATNKRIQDQIALESVLQAACGFQSEISRGTNSQFSGKTFRNPNQSGDTGVWTVNNGHKVVNRSFYDDGLLTGQCLNGEKVGQLFEKHIPQRDSEN